MTQLLLVEGLDDKHVVRQIREKSVSMPAFGISDKEGVDRLLESIEAEIKAPGRKAVGILVDANDDPQARWEAVAYRLERVGFNCPSVPTPMGFVVDGGLDFGHRRVGVWLMPDNESAGELEDFIAGLIPPQDTVWPLSRDYIARISAPKFSANKVRRAEVHAWLATRERPRRMGQAIRTNDLDIESDVCKRLVAWLRKLFAESDSGDASAFQ